MTPTRSSTSTGRTTSRCRPGASPHPHHAEDAAARDALRLDFSKTIGLLVFRERRERAGDSLRAQSNGGQFTNRDRPAVKSDAGTLGLPGDESSRTFRTVLRYLKASPPAEP